MKLDWGARVVGEVEANGKVDRDCDDGEDGNGKS